MEIGKEIIRYGLDAVIGGLVFFNVLIRVALGLDAIGTIGTILAAVGVVWLFLWTLKIHPGRENLFDVLPALVLTPAILAVFKIPLMEVTITGLGFTIAVTSILLSDVIVRRYLIKG